MGCNCEGKTINIGMGCCQPVLAPIENYYTKSQVDKLIEDIEVSGVTEEEVDEKISSATSGMATEQWVEDQHYLTEHQSLSGYATEEWVEDKHYITGVDLSDYALKSEIPTVPTNVSAFVNDVPYLTEHQSLSGYATEEFVSGYTYDKQTIDEKVAQGGTFDPSQYYDKTSTNALLDEKLDVSAFTAYSGTVASELSEKASQSTVDTLNENIQTVSAQVQTIVSGEVTSAEVQTMIEESISGKTNESDFTAHTANTDIHVTTAQTASWDAKSNFSGSYNDLTDKPTIPTIWSGTEEQWSQISGGTLDNNCIYLVY